jgi:3-isopropylmalate/(R)-2-methylmalate dehydratase small subunit
VPVPGLLRGRAYCIEGVLDVDWDISPIEDMFFIRDAVVNQVGYEDQLRRLAAHCLAKVDPDFSSKIGTGDFLVGSRGLGWGHGHDHAALALKAVGLGAVLCETTGVNFKRNCINHGLPLVEIPGIFSQVTTGDELELDLVAGTLRNLTTGAIITFQTYPAFILEILDAGGIYEQMSRQIGCGNMSFQDNEEVS